MDIQIVNTNTFLFIIILIFVLIIEALTSENNFFRFCRGLYTICKY